MYMLHACPNQLSLVSVKWQLIIIIGRKCAYVPMVVAILTIVVIIAPLCGTVWRNLFVKPEFDVTLFENDTIVVCELDSYYHKQVQLLSQPDAPLGNHVVEIYLFNSTCNSVPTSTEAKSFEKSNISEN